MCLNVKHRANVIAPVQLNGAVSTGQTMVPLDTAKGSIQQHLARPGQNGGFPKLGVPFGGPYNKGYSIGVSILGSHYFGKLPNSGFAAVRPVKGKLLGRRD